MSETKSPAPLSPEYDLVVIGSGPAGQRAAVQSAKLGKKVLVIEKEKIGGSCLHTGTVPSKALREAALRLQGENAVQVAMERSQRVVQEESAVIAHQLNRNSVEFVSGTGSFGSKNSVVVTQATGRTEVRAKFIFLATGTRPRRQADICFDGKFIFDSDTILNMTSQPKRMLVIGAGVIGCEYASIFAHTGVAVTLIDRRQELLRAIDQEIVGVLQNHFIQEKIDVRLGYDFSEFKLTGQAMQVTLADHHGHKFVQEFEAVLYCMGRIGNVESLHLENVGLKPDERGLINVNKNYQTAVPEIYAVGDVIGQPALAASSSEQGRLAALHAFQNEEAHFPETFPYGIYTIPEISSVGAQEEDLQKNKIAYVVGRAQYRELARGKIINDEHGFLKLLVDVKTEKILGVHVIGTGATELVHIGQTAMAFGATVDFFVKNVFNYPTLAEAYKVAAYSALNLLRAVRR